MSSPVTQFDPFKPETFAHRYEFDRDEVAVHDRKYRRDIEAKSKRGGPVYYRLVDEAGKAHHVLARDIFGGDAPVLQLKSEFDPRDFADRYDFDWERHRVRQRRSGKLMKLAVRNGWKHYFLRNNDGRRVAVTPAEIRDYSPDGGRWVVALPKGARTAKLPFPDLAFTPDGAVWKVASDQPLIRPEQVAIAEPGGTPATSFYHLTGASGRVHRVSKQSVIDVFKSNPNIK